MQRDVAAGLVHVELRHRRVVGAGPRHEHVVDWPIQIVEEAFELFEVRDVEGSDIGPERAAGLTEAVEVARGDDHLGSVLACEPGRLDPDAGTAAHHYDRLPEEFALWLVRRRGGRGSRLGPRARWPETFMSAARFRPAPPPCTRRTSRANSRRIRPPDVLLVLAVRNRRAAHRVRQVSRGCECRLARVDSSGKPLRDLLQQPFVAVRIGEGRERAVGSVLGVGAAEATGSALCELRARRAGVEDLGDFHSKRGELGARRLDVRDDQVKALGTARLGRCELRAELDRGARPGRRELDYAEAVVERKVGVEPPPESRVELFERSESATGITTTSSFRSSLLRRGCPQSRS